MGKVAGERDPKSGIRRRHEGAVAVVTGASSGIGRAIARRLAGEGARVVIADLQEQPRDADKEIGGPASTANLIRTEGGEAIFVEADVGCSGDMEETVARAVSEFGALNVFVNNAGIWHGHRTILEETEAEFDLTMTTNIKGVWTGSRAAIGHMARTKSGGS